MTREQIFEKLAAIETSIHNLNSEILTRKVALRIEIESILEDFFKMPEGVRLVANRHQPLPSNYAYEMFDESRNEYKEIISLYLESRYEQEESSKYVSRVYPSFYTTQINSNFEFKRMVVIGIVGRVFVERNEELLTAIQSQYNSHYPEIGTLVDQKYDLQKESDSLDKVLKTYDKSDLTKIQKLFHNPV
jgi:hypothetical protein